MRTKGQTSIHLLLASIVTMFGTMLILLTLSMSWEHWMIPIIVMGNTMVWFLHIGRVGSEGFYETLCAGLLLVGFFFYGVHSAVLFDIPAVACMILLVFSMFDKKRLLYITIGLYLLELLYHFLLLHTVTSGMGIQNIVRLGFGASVVAGSMAIAMYRINKRREDRTLQDSILAQLETTGRQNAEFLSNVSHELRTPTNMVLGISEVILEKDISPGVREDMRSIQLAGKRLSSQINNMLDYTEIVEGTLTPSNEPYMIASVLNDVITMAAMQKSLPLEQQFSVLRLQAALRQLPKGRHVRKHRADEGLGRAGADEVPARPLAQHRPHGVDDDALARAGLAGQGVEAPVEGDVRLLDNRDVLNVQKLKHSPTSLSASSASRGSPRTGPGPTPRPA